MTKNSERGKVLDSVLLYSDECLDLLQRAGEKIEMEYVDSELDCHSIQVGSTPAFQFVLSDADDDDIWGDNQKTSTPGSSFSGEDSSVETISDNLNPAADSQVNPASRPRKSKQPQTNEAKQRYLKIQHHNSIINRLSFPLDSKIELLVPFALMKRQHNQSLSLSAKCASIRNLALQLNVNREKKPVVVLLLRSGRFAAGVFCGSKCVEHTSSQRYTVRKGQGKAQSSQDGNRHAKSMGSQLRRAGEQSLKEDVHATVLKWRQHFQTASLILVSCPKTMRPVLFAAQLGEVLTKNDPRLRTVPFDVGRPSFEGVSVVYEVITTLEVREKKSGHLEKPLTSSDINSSEMQQSKSEIVEAENPRSPETIPLTELHVAARDGNLARMLEILSKAGPNMVNKPAGHDFMTPLHFAAESSTKVDPGTSAACVSALLCQAQADPTIVDARLRLPYFLASHDKSREAFRKARAVLGNDHCDWELAKVGPPLTEKDVRRKKEKEAEKKRRKKSKLKEKKEQERAQAEEIEQRGKEEEKTRKGAENAKIERDAHPPKAAENICDFCRTECKGRKRLLMFKRLDYKFCSTDCLQKHKREVMAQAAMARFT